MAIAILPPDIAAALNRCAAKIDQDGWPPELVADWKKIRGYVRNKQRESQQVVPAVALAAQEMSASRNHAQAALDAMSAVFGQTRSDDEDESPR